MPYIVKSSLDISGKIIPWNEQEVNKLIKEKTEKFEKIEQPEIKEEPKEIEEETKEVKQEVKIDKKNKKKDKAGEE